MKQVPTAVELFNSKFNINCCYIDYDRAGLDTIKQAMIEFAKIHVETALKEASQKAECKEFMTGSYVVNKESILNSYPLTNIK
jgi:hypothetical protein